MGRFSQSEAVPSTHPLSVRRSYRNTISIKSFEAVYVDTKKVRCHALSMKRINAAHFAKIMVRRVGVKLILGE